MNTEELECIEESIGSPFYFTSLVGIFDTYEEFSMIFSSPNIGK
jgi:hypothetical protein